MAKWIEHSTRDQKFWGSIPSADHVKCLVSFSFSTATAISSDRYLVDGNCVLSDYSCLRTSLVIFVFHWDHKEPVLYDVCAVFSQGK